MLNGDGERISRRQGREWPKCRVVVLPSGGYARFKGVDRELKGFSRSARRKRTDLVTGCTRASEDMFMGFDMGSSLVQRGQRGVSWW